jgi:hypothetical protein
LFTFLATLFLLLFVSSAIILRSFILRRRFRRSIEEALLAGVIVPNQPGGRVSRRRALGEKPKLWETRVFPADDDGWDSIVPVSALPKGSEPPNKEDSETSAPAPLPRPISYFSQPARPPPLYRRLFHNPFSRHAGSLTHLHDMSTAAPSSPGESASEQGAPPHHDRMEVTVLIAMPDPRRPHPSAGFPKGKDFDYDEDDLPEMVLGMVESRYKDSNTPPTSP